MDCIQNSWRRFKNNIAGVKGNCLFGMSRTYASAVSASMQCTGFVWYFNLSYLFQTITKLDGECKNAWFILRRSCYIEWYNPAHSSPLQCSNTERNKTPNIYINISKYNKYKLRSWILCRKKSGHFNAIVRKVFFYANSLRKCPNKNAICGRLLGILFGLNSYKV